MSNTKPITSALISVFNKEGLQPIVEKLNEQNVIIYSTGGTQQFINELGIDVVPVEDITSYPSILGGRVKTLHPKVFGGILNRQDHVKDMTEISEFEIPQIDCVIVDLYPFEKTVTSGASKQDIIEKIDIGGISLIRAAAKNYNDVIRLGTLRYAYLGHMRPSVLSSPPNQLSRWIVPLLVYFWRSKGKETAEKWAIKESGETNTIITELISDIDKAVHEALSAI